ncbi:MAG: hypothetical protein U1C33_05105, partial [Candidatus Cloacimonadaceae bacterium]|nr:hypothetical protein [Candidatus Cloacimonadaceae bacterium]
MKTRNIILVVLLVILTFGIVYAQEVEEAAQTQATQATTMGVGPMLVKIVNDSEFFGYLIIAVFIVGLAIGAVRY